MSALPPVQRVSLHRVSPTLGFADVRLAEVHLRSLRVERRADGSLVITPPGRSDGSGRTWPLYALQPGTREAVEREIAVVWGHSA